MDMTCCPLSFPVLFPFLTPPSFLSLLSSSSPPLPLPLSPLSPLPPPLYPSLSQHASPPSLRPRRCAMKGGLPHFVCMACYNENYTIDENYTQDALDHKQNKVLLKKQQNDKPCVHDKSRAHHAEEEGFRVRA